MKTLYVLGGLVAVLLGGTKTYETKETGYKDINQKAFILYRGPGKGDYVVNFHGDRWGPITHDQAIWEKVGDQNYVSMNYQEEWELSYRTNLFGKKERVSSTHIKDRVVDIFPLIQH